MKNKTFVKITLLLLFFSFLSILVKAQEIPQPTPPPIGGAGSSNSYSYYDEATKTFKFKDEENIHKVVYNGPVRFSQESRPEDIEYYYTSEEDLLKEYLKNIENPEWIKERNTICYGDDCFIPKERKGRSSERYFKSLGLKEEDVYVTIQFEHSKENLGDKDPSKKQLKLLQRKGIEVLDQGRYLVARVPRNFLERGQSISLWDRIMGKKSDFEFIRWMDIREPDKKLSENLKAKMNEEDGPFIIVVEGYEDFTDSQVKIIEKLSKNEIAEVNDDRLKINIGPSKIEEISSFTFVNSIDYWQPVTIVAL